MMNKKIKKYKLKMNTFLLLFLKFEPKLWYGVAGKTASLKMQFN